MGLAAGTRIGAYEIEAAIGAGGMGEVYRARDRSLDRTVAIKVLPDSFKVDDSARKRFLREARLAAALDHPYICSIHELLEVAGDSFIVMELVEGETLRQRLARGAVPHQEALRIGLEIAEALEKAHRAGIVHRDLKPSNIMLTAEGHVKVMDFGLAKRTDATETDQEETRSLLTRQGTTVGTLAYMSPEQVEARALTPASDLFSFGIVLTEMLTGTHPFKKAAALDTAHAILYATPSWPPAALPAISDEVSRLLHALLAKQPGGRGSAHEAKSTLARLIELTAPQPRVRRAVARPAVLIPAIVAALAVLLFAYRWSEGSKRAAWAHDVALPEIERLTENGDALAAFNLASQAEKYLADSKALAALRQSFSSAADIKSDPPGATVWWKGYSAKDADWTSLGQTPIAGRRVPAVFSSLRLEKDGYEPLLVAAPLARPLSFTLERTGSLPKDMVRVPASVFTLALPGMDHLRGEPIGAFLIDKYEVTNRAYKRFVDEGGYREVKYWKYPFVADGQTLSWERAIDRFKDRTGRPGPATWEGGDYPDGQDDYPVSGVSWYEAAAYAEYVGRSLPTIYQWYTAAGMPSSAYIVPLSNLGATVAPAAVGTYRGLGPFGTYDMAGNAREWCRNDSTREGQRFILGGAWNDPAYAFGLTAVTQPPFDRSTGNGFRCVKNLGGTGQEDASARTIRLAFRDFFKEKPSSDKEFEVFVRQYGYDQTPLNAQVVARDTSADAWTKEKISFDAAYGNERVFAYLFLPKRVRLPYQVVFFWPGDSGLQIRSSDNLELVRVFDFIVKSGRAVMFPVFKSMYERGDGLASSIPDETNNYKEHVVMWVKDARRSIDYLRTRSDIDPVKLAYFGHSAGGRLAPIPLAVDDRFKAAVLYVAGFRFPRSQPEVDPFNFVTHVKIPVLMLNGRYDHYFPVESAQKPMFMLLGTPAEDKKWVRYDGGHFVPRDQLIGETLTWLDRYLGSVR